MFLDTCSLLTLLTRVLNVGNALAHKSGPHSHFVRGHEGEWDQAFWGSPVCTKALSCEVIFYLETKAKDNFGWGLGCSSGWRRVVRLNQISSTKQNLEFGVSTEEYGEERGSFSSGAWISRKHAFSPCPHLRRSGKVWRQFGLLWLGKCRWHLAVTRAAARSSRTKHHSKKLSVQKMSGTPLMNLL